MPGRTALVCGEVRWSYAELDAVVERVAQGLRGIGVGAGDKVAILARNSHAFTLSAMRFAIARAGAVLVPVNFMLNADELAYILGHCGARVLCTDSDLAVGAPRPRRERISRSSSGCRARRPASPVPA